MMLVITGLPILAALQFLGGVDPQLVLAGFAATLLTVASVAGLSIFNSVLCRRAARRHHPDLSDGRRVSRSIRSELGTRLVARLGRVPIGQSGDGAGCCRGIQRRQHPLRPDADARSGGRGQRRRQCRAAGLPRSLCDLPRDHRRPGDAGASCGCGPSPCAKRARRRNRGAAVCVR